MYQPSQLQAFLQGLGISAKKSLSQNFLIDGNIIRKIVAAAQVTAGDVVLEIGPGPGALTNALLEAGAHVIAVEKDRILAEALPRLVKEGQQLEVITNDIMDFSVEAELTKRLKAGTKAKVIANLPYHLTTPILTGLAPLHKVIASLTVMVQKEVARRMAAPPGGFEYGSLTVFLEVFAKVHLDFIVSRNCFFPKPKVDSAVVTLRLHPPPPLADLDAFFRFTRTAFEQRRKMLRRSLDDLYTPEAVTLALQELSLNPEARPEQLSLDDFLRLFDRLNRGAC